MAQINRVKAARKFAGFCEKCSNKIFKGAPYKWIGVKPPGSQPGARRIRCGDCEDWHEWDYNPSLGAQCRKVAHDTEFHLRYSRSYEDERGAELVMKDAAAEIGIFANTRQVSADRTRYVFGEKNFRTQQFNADAEALRRWARQIGNWRCPPLPDPELTDCSLCSAKRMDLDAGGDAACAECQGAGRYYPEKPGEEQLEDWRHEVADDARDVLEGCPL